jgi:hypothetical protein
VILRFFFFLVAIHFLNWKERNVDLKKSTFSQIKKKKKKGIGLAPLSRSFKNNVTS